MSISARFRTSRPLRLLVVVGLAAYAVLQPFAHAGPPVAHARFAAAVESRSAALVRGEPDGIPESTIAVTPTDLASTRFRGTAGALWGKRDPSA